MHVAIHGYGARMLVTGGFEGLAWVTWDRHIRLFSNKLSPYQPESLKKIHFQANVQQYEIENDFLQTFKVVNFLHKTAWQGNLTSKETEGYFVEKVKARMN